MGVLSATRFKKFGGFDTRLLLSGGDESETCSKSLTEAITFDIGSVGDAVVINVFNVSDVSGDDVVVGELVELGNGGPVVKVL